jgi:D-alanyl-D-alanine dipeptidase
MARVPIRECGDALVDVEASGQLLVATSPTYRRLGVVERLVTAQSLLPRTARLLITEGYTRTDPAPAAVAPHPTGGAVDLTLLDAAAATCTAATPPPPESTRQLLAAALTAAGLVNFPTQWWHWSYGDRFWAFVTQAPHSRYGPLPTH